MCNQPKGQKTSASKRKCVKVAVAAAAAAAAAAAGLLLLQFECEKVCIPKQ